MNKRIFLSRMAALALAALFAIAPLPARSEGGFLSSIFGSRSPEPTPASIAPAGDIAASAIEDDGVVRVYLSSLKSPKTLTIALDGVYTVEHDAGFRFERGTQIVLWDGGDGVWMDVGGLSISMGPSLTLTRQAAGDGEENGLRIAETGRNTLLAGDLSVSREDNGGLHAVLAINMEDYLCGVIAYEMSDSWPIEALKAQAVAARTYAMRAKWNSGNRDYDVVDTTGDQVFRGYNPEYTTVAEAVRATAGVVGTYNGGFATCYYTASNGGETALPSDVWGDGGDYGYLERKADPYDLENGNSMVAELSFTPGATGQSALIAMLQAGLEEVSGIEGIEFEAIQAVEPVDPIAEGSIVCKKLRFTVTATAPAPPTPPMEDPAVNLALYAIDWLNRLLQVSPAEEQSEERVVLEQTFAVDLDVYDQIKDGLGLSINGGDYEVVSVVEDAFGFTIQFRRFGHGVGMSQRGAQTMAGAHGMSYTDILNFYYPGMTLERIDWRTPELTALDALPDVLGRARPEPTPTPSPAPLPALEDGEYYARVALDDTGSSMNLRQNPSTQAPVVARLSHNQRVIVSGEPDGDGWVRVRTAEYEGYAKLEYLAEE